MILSRRNKLLLSFSILFFLSFAIVAGYVYSLINAPMITDSNAVMVINLDRSATAYQFVHQLKEKQLIKSPQFLLSVIRYQNLAHKLKAGVYQIKPGESALQLLERVVAGDVIIQNFKIIAGTTQQKIVQDLTHAPYLEYKPEDWTLIASGHPNAEGLLLADTYQYRGGSTSNTLLEQAHRNLLNYLNDSWANRAPNLPYHTAYELLIAASIIEKETALATERKLIAGVMVNRLNKTMPLQMDPTVIYALGNAYTGKLSHKDMQYVSPYNSYINRGLPPTPIAMVGKEAIDAAAHPQLSKYLYFVAKGDGSHQFSETYDQQRAAIEQNRHKGF